VLEIYGGALLRPIGTIKLNCVFNNIEQNLCFVVADVESVPLLGLLSCEKFGLVKCTPRENILKQIYKVSLCVASNGSSYVPVSDAVNNVNSVSTIKVEKREVTFASPLVTIIPNSGDTLNLETRESVIQSNPNVFVKYAGKIPKKFQLSVDPKVRPIAIPSRRVPHKLKSRYKTFFCELCDQGIIIKCSKPVGWVSPVVLIEKPDISLRICFDPKHLNEALSRPFFEIPSAEDINTSLCNKKYFSVLDFSSGFWHCELDEQSSNACQFSTPFGVFKFLRLPFGLKSSPEIFQSAVCDIFVDIDGVLIYCDDLLIAANSEEEHDMIYKKVMERAMQYNVNFNPDKLQYKQNVITFMGWIYSEAGRTIDPDRLEANKKLQNPANVTELQRLLGIMNFVREFIPGYAHDTNLLRQLVRKNVVWQWLQAHTEALENLKAKICNATSLCNFDPSQPVTIQCDASQYGLGACLLQNNKPIAFASRSLIGAEVNYAQIEKELLAIVYACQKFHHFICGHPDVLVHTDHKPLISIFKQSLAEISSKRLARLITKTLSYTLKVEYLPGKLMFIADALSRDFLQSDASEEVKMYQVHFVRDFEGFTNDEIYVQQTKEDVVLQELIKYVKTGWPRSKHKLSLAAQLFWHVRLDLVFEDSLLFFKNRLVVPTRLRQQMLGMVHGSHQGIVKSKSLAKQSVYWPGMNSEIEQYVNKCSVCAKYSPSQKKVPMYLHDVPELPYEMVSCDILDFKGKPYLVVIDNFKIVQQEVHLRLKSIISYRYIHGSKFFSKNF